jgi:hypothetical protein
MAALAGVLGAAAVIAACITALAIVIPLALAALLVGALLCLIAGGCFAAGYSRIRTVDPLPHRTLETLREGVKWVQHRNR